MKKFSSSEYKKQSLRSRELKDARCCYECSYVVDIVMSDANNKPVVLLFCLCDFWRDLDQWEKVYRLLQSELTGKPVSDKNYSEELRQVLEITPEDSVTDSPRYTRYSQVCQYQRNIYE